MSSGLRDKHRHPLFAAAHLARLLAIMRAGCRDFGSDLVCKGELDHVHLLACLGDLSGTRDGQRRGPSRKHAS
jgi:hypothetical protein